MIDLTVIILTKNEENNIEKCIKSFGPLAKRFVIIDSYSTDNTLLISKRLGADIYQNEFVDHSTQVNWGLENVDYDSEWIMRIDADEELTEELANEIREKLSNLSANINGVNIRRRVYFMGKWIKHGGIYPTILLRIFRNGKAYCEQKVMDEYMVLKEGDTINFKYDLIDKNTKDLTWWINKHNWYSNKEVIDYNQTILNLSSNDNIKPSLFGSHANRKRWLKYRAFYKTPLMIRAHWYFIYRYILRLGFLDGKEGLIFHFLQGYWYRFLVDAKIFELKKTDNKEEPEDLKT